MTWFSDYSDSVIRVNIGSDSYKGLVKQRDELGGNTQLIFDHY